MWCRTARFQFVHARDVHFVMGPSRSESAVPFRVRCRCRQKRSSNGGIGPDFATDRGRAGYGNTRYEFAKLIWQTASPKWRFDDATFNRSARAFDNPDHVSLVIHNYRWRLGLAEGESKIQRSRKTTCDTSGDHGAHHHA